MEILLPAALSLIIAYFIGAIPTGFWAGKMLKGIDIREHGSKNMGATNVMRVLGKGPGIVVLLIDILKGILPLTVVPNLLGITDPLVLVFIGAAAVAGHNWTIFLGFKGGKGVATSLGVLIGLAIQISGIRPVLLIVVGVWIVVFASTGFVSLASILAATALPILMVTYNAPFPIKVLSILLCVFIVLRHRSNISRLLKGQENRFKLPYFK
jgi:acyl phosphate:glycerol-3-phosphate acyltransferase